MNQELCKPVLENVSAVKARVEAIAPLSQKIRHDGDVEVVANPRVSQLIEVASGPLRIAQMNAAWHPWF